LQERRIQLEDVLKAAYKISFQKKVMPDDLIAHLKYSGSRLRGLLQWLTRKDLVQLETDGAIILTDQGKDHANKLVRAHRLWESYLVSEMGMDVDQIHDEAERAEHILTSEQVEEVDKRLGYPALDPHGSPIPSNERIPATSLKQLAQADKAFISHRQPGAEITYQLWSLGIGPGDLIRVLRHDPDFVIQVNDNTIRVPQDLAGKVSVEQVNS
jgi:Mn-dependent DtxR family transcriptional regulator